MGDYNSCGCWSGLSVEKWMAVSRSKKIDRMLREDRKNQCEQIILLLLGAAESGKTTFIKQMRINHGRGYSEDERRGYTELIYQNIFQSMRAMTEAMKTLEIPYANTQNEIYAKWFHHQDIHQITQLQRSYVEAIRHLWADQGFKMCYKRRREYQLLDSTKYFIHNLDRITAEDYIPTDEDILRVRSPTKSITEESISIRSLTFRIVDVGGQRGQRRKWIHYFDNVMYFIFLASLSEYDQLLEENKNRMEESLSLFHKTISLRRIACSPIILFLNKMDILEEKIQFSDLKTYFPAFEGKRQDMRDAMEFIRDLYEQNVISERNKTIHSHFICATDSGYSQQLYGSVAKIIISENLRHVFSL